MKPFGIQKQRDRSSAKKFETSRLVSVNPRTVTRMPFFKKITPQTQRLQEASDNSPHGT